ncbi:hypothetical protein N656DRAFT_476569 [Canariomyces notabilis]|uniref:Uncharacterized protein n=1 Tax=Canariomyces notabilis TaxID=2074819 RepID=A0AAN6TII5_9PEZI|nr:hypothetical protein N656DRAFT_476569 [Canariomyces arenarius]
MAARQPAGFKPVEMLQQILTDVVVTTGKAFKAARQDGNGSLAEAAVAMETRIPASIEKFNWTLDELEIDIIRAKAVYLRDLNQCRANRKPAQQDQQPVAPPAPMAVDLTSPRMEAKGPPTGLSGPPRPGKPANKPVAPFPNMGFDSSSPELKHIPSPKPVPKPVPKPKEVKNHAPPAVPTAGAATTTVRPASAPPKKETKISPPQGAKPGTGSASVGQSPLPAHMQIKASSVPAPNLPPSGPTPTNAPPVSTTSGHENIFTDMTFSLAPPPQTTTQGQKEPAAPLPPPQAQRKQPQQQQQQRPPQVIDLTDLGPGPGAAADSTTASAAKAGQPTGAKPGPGPGPGKGTASGGGDNNGPAADAAETNQNPGQGPGGGGGDKKVVDIDAEINGLFDLGPGGMDGGDDFDYDPGADHGDNSNFNDMYFGAGNSSGGGGEFDDHYFNLNG